MSISPITSGSLNLVDGKGSLNSNAQQASITGPRVSSPTSITASPSDFGYWDLKTKQDLNQAGTMFAQLAKEYTSLTDKISSERPDIAAQKFDFETSSDGSLKVVSNTMSKSDKDWLQQQLNGDQNLVSLANKFDSLLVQGYSSDYQLKSPNGGEDTDNFQKDAETTYNYNNLASTIAGSVKFVGLMNQLQGNEKVAESQPHVTSVSYTDPATSFYGSAGYVAQQFLPANITQNVLGSDGQWEPTQRVGTIVSDWM